MCFFQPLPDEFMMKMMNIPYSNYKTQICKFFQLEGKCKFGNNCSFAHGEDQLRKPYEPLPQNASLLMNQNKAAGTAGGNTMHSDEGPSGFGKNGQLNGGGKG